MHRYYMNAETQAALIAESQRLIAARAERTAPHRLATPANDDAWSNTMPAVFDEAESAEDRGDGSTFASLVSDLWSASSSTRRAPVRELELVRAAGR